LRHRKTKSHGPRNAGRHRKTKSYGPRNAGLIILALLAASLAGVVLPSLANDPSETSVTETPRGPASAKEQPLHTPTPTPTPTPVPVDAPLVLGQVQAAAATTGGSIAVAVFDATDRALLVSPDYQRPIFTASLIKPLIIAELLARQEAGELVLSPNDLVLMQRAATASDDNAMNTLWVRYDGPALVSAAATRLGLSGTAPPAEVGQWGQAVTTANDMATFLSRMDQAFGAQVAATLTGWLQATTMTAADGSGQLFGVLSPSAGAAGPVAAKQGWMCCKDDRRQLHSAGVLADGRTVVLLGDFPDAVPWSAAIAALDAAAAAVVSGTAD
jgi:hypothetical protein